jgi:hypothetical protein
MKNIMKKLIDRFFSDGSTRQDSLLLVSILSVILVYRIAFFLIFYPGIIHYNSDSVTYFTEGFFDLYRTPVYPLLISFFGYFSEKHFLDYLLYFQQFISFISIFPFFYCAKKMIPNKYIAAAACICYGTLPFLILQNININPESLCISGSVFMFYFFTQNIHQPNTTNAILCGLFPLLLILLKPTYLILVVLVILFQMLGFILMKEQRKKIAIGFIGSLISIAGILAYCKMNEKVNGEFLLTKIYFDNSLGNIILSGAYKNGEDEELIALIDSTKDKTEFTYYNAIYHVNNESMDSYKKSYAKFPKYLTPYPDMEFSYSVPDIKNYENSRIASFIQHSKSSGIYKTYIWKRAMRILKDYYPIAILIFLQISFLISIYFKTKSILWLQLFCIGFILSQAFTVVIGGIEDWSRLLLPSFPFILFSIFSFLQQLISFKLNGQSEKQAP